jgi:hypothetical protein
MGKTLAEQNGMESVFELKNVCTSIADFILAAGG